jgi:hypothetical protein
MNARKLTLAVIIGLFAAAVVPMAEAAPLPSITLTWTAPGDDGASGTATAYEARWSSTQPDTTSPAAMTTWWNAATPVPNMPSPQVAGTQQNVTVSPASGFPYGFTYYFVLRTRDEANNWSGNSNVARRPVTDTTGPAPVTDLRAE